MRSISILIAIFSCIQFTNAQHLEIPQLSPFSKLEQKVGLTDVTIEYSRPSMKERKVFGGLVPYGELWRTGANLNTTITFSNDVKLNGQKIAKGSYAIFTIPAVKEWEIIVYDAPHGYTPQKLEDSKVLTRFTVPVILNPIAVETFTIELNQLKTSSATLCFKWDKVSVDISLNVPADEMAMKNIQNLIEGPSADDLFNAAEYYFHNDKDLNLALDWTRLSAKKYGWDAYWPHYLEARILAKQGKINEAIMSGEKAAAFVRKAGYLVVANQLDDQVKEWKTMR